MFRVCYNEISWLDLDFFLKFQLTSSSFVLRVDEEDMSQLYFSWIQFYFICAPICISSFFG